MNKIDFLNQVIIYVLSKIEERFPHCNEDLNWRIVIKDEEFNNIFNNTSLNIKENDKLEYFKQANLLLVENGIIAVNNKDSITSMQMECLVNKPRLTLKGLSKISSIPNILKNNPNYEAEMKTEMLKTFTKSSSQTVIELLRVVVSSFWA